MSILKANVSFRSKPTQLFYTAVLEAFQPRPQTGVFSADRLGLVEGSHSDLALCIRALLPLACDGRKTLDTSIFSLLTMYLGHLVDNAEMKDMAQSAYTSALGDFRRFLGSTFPLDSSCYRLDRCQLALTLCMTMALFEV